MELTRDQKILLLEEGMKRKALKSFPYFVDKIINYDNKWKIADFQFEVMRAVQQYPELLLLLPRGHGKSELITVAYPIWKMCVNPNIKILIRNENSDNAEKFLAAIKDVLTQNKMLISLFGEFQSNEKWSSDQIVIKQRTQIGMKDPTIATGGLNKSMVGGHFNLIIDDDLVSDRNTQTLDQIQKVIDFHKNTPPLQDAKDFQWITIGTRWHYFDLYNHIITNESEVKVILKRAVDGDIETGKILFPELFNREKLLGLKKKLGSYIFSCQYQNEPIDDSEATFKHEWIESMYREYSRPSNMNIFVLLDPAISQEKRADFTSILVAAIDVNKHINILKIVRDKLTLDEMLNYLFIFNETYHPILYGIETNAFQKVLLYHLQKEMQEREIYLPIKDFSSHTKKEVRIRALQPVFERGEIHCDRLVENSDYLEYELMAFPKGEHDDVIDTLASVLKIGFAPEPDIDRTPEKVDINAYIINRMFEMRDEFDNLQEETVEDFFTPYDEIETIY